MDTVPLVMIAATKIGERQGQELRIKRCRNVAGMSKKAPGDGVLAADGIQRRHYNGVLWMR